MEDKRGQGLTCLRWREAQERKRRSYYSLRDIGGSGQTTNGSLMTHSRNSTNP